MDTTAFLSYLKSLSFYQGQIEHLEHIPPRQAQYGPLEKPLPPPLEARLKEKGLFPLYSHQASAINRLRRGENVVVSAPSASGKTLCYNIPVLEAVLQAQAARALYLFPTKALAQDQWRALTDLACPTLLSPAEGGTFDGDTPTEERPDLKKRARIVLTNPDMLHLGILPNHASWTRLFHHLKYVVVDEAHAYSGVFGSHMGLVLRRLRRVCSLYGSHPQFILCSATLANPREHAQNLVGLPFELVAEDGSPHGGKDFVFWNPPFIGHWTRRSANTEASFLLSELVRQHIRSLAFARTRKLTELIAIYAKNHLEETEPSLAQRIKPYRAGYLPQLRRQIEQELFRGELLGVVATTALELGVDIGDLDATILTGYPGSIASTWQQAGRSGRRGESSLSFLIGLDNPLDQYLMRHPQAFLDKRVEHALINPQNPHLLQPHLLCAAWELPLAEEDKEIFGLTFPYQIGELEERGLLRQRGGRYYPSPTLPYPAQQLNLRATAERPVAIIDASRGGLLETVEASLACLQTHPGAIYLHQGETYLIQELDLISQTAYARPMEADYYTQPMELTELRIIKTHQSKDIAGVRVYLGEVEVSQQVIGFRKKRQFTEEVLGEELLDLPPYVFPTIALWFSLPPGAEAGLSREGLDLAGGLHALEHAAIALLPLFALCDRNDIGGLSTPRHPDTGKPQVFIYDAYPGGVGIAEKGFELVTQLWQATLEALQLCPCEEGCPSCVQSPKCGNNNQPLDKGAALYLLHCLLRGGKEE